MRNFAVAILAIGFFSPAVFAGDSVNSHLFHFSDTAETVILEDAIGPDSELVKEGGKVMLHFSYDYMHEPLIAVNDARSIQLYNVVDHLHSFTWGGGGFVHRKIWLGATIPLHWVKLGNPFSTLPSSKWVFGDIEMHAKIRVTSDEAPFNAAIMPLVFFPTGNDGYVVSDNSMGVGAKILADKHWDQFTVFTNIGFTYASNAHFFNIDRSSRMGFGGGTYFKILDQPAQQKSLGLNVEANWDLTVSSLDQNQNPLDFRVGLRGRTGKASWFLGTGFSSITKARSGDIGAYAGVKVGLGSTSIAALPPPVVAPPSPPVVESLFEPTPPPPIEVPVVPLDESVIEPSIKPSVKPVPEWKKKIEIFGRIVFKTSSTDIEPVSFKDLDIAVTTILNNAASISKVVIHGHTDSTGDAGLNIWLSQERADAVKNYLIMKNVPTEKLEAVGHGEALLKYSLEKNPKEQALNRRVIFEVIQVENQESVK